MRSFTRTISIALMLLAASAAAQDFRQLPDPGKLLGYVAAESPGKWLVFGPNRLWPVQPTVLESGAAVMWQGDAGEYAVIFLPPGDAQPLTTIHVLGADEPPPPDPPGPDPDPDPDDKLSDLAKNVRDWATTLVPTSARVKSGLVARSLDTIRAQMAAGTLTDPAKVIAATRDANQTAVGSDRAAWLPFFEQLRRFLNNESEAGRLASIEDHMRTWEDISAGLKAVK